MGYCSNKSEAILFLDPRLQSGVDSVFWSRLGMLDIEKGCGHGRVLLVVQ